MDGTDRLTSFFLAQNSRQPEILVVEDDPDQRESLAILLQDHGYRITTAASAEEAVILCGRNEFDICICDWRLPGMPGHQLIGEIKLLHPSCQSILLTGYGDFEVAQAAVNSGADGFVVKPVNPPFLLSLLEGALFQRLLMQEHERFEGVLQTLRTFRHEVGNPMQALLGNVELLGRHVKNNPAAERYMENVRTAADQLMDLLDRLDSLKRLTTRESPIGPMLDLPNRLCPQ